MYLSSPDDTAEHEVDSASVGTILFAAIRPEFRGAVRCCFFAWLGCFAAWLDLSIRASVIGRVISLS